jgi:hypothetical protein
VGPETTGEQSQPVLQVTNLAKAHLVNDSLLKLRTQESAVKRQRCSCQGDIRGRSQLSLRATLELTKMPWQIMLSTRTPATEKQHGRAACIVCAPKRIQTAYKTEKRFVWQPSEDWRLREKV